jgi:fermentation-respiration switch protein FrsA (DUF1100 family)
MKKKIFIVASIIILILIIIVIAIVGNYFYDLALNPKSSKTIVFGEDEPKTEEQILRQMQKEKWLTDYAKDISIESKDGLLLHAYEISQSKNTKKWTIVVHGYMSEGKQMTDSSKQFLDIGYNVLIVDLRGHGKSEGDYIGMGWHDRLDIIKWIEYLIKKQPDCEIVLYGVSMGAATVMMTTGEELPTNVKCAIEDCGYTSVWDEFAAQLKDLFNLPTFPALNAANLVTRMRAGYEFKEASSVEQVKKSKTPTLFIHGDQDTFVPYTMLDEVYNAANCEKEKLVIEGAEHAESVNINATLYWSTVKSFIEKYVK